MEEDLMKSRYLLATNNYTYYLRNGGAGLELVDNLLEATLSFDYDDDLEMEEKTTGLTAVELRIEEASESGGYGAYVLGLKNSDLLMCDHNSRFWNENYREDTVKLSSDWNKAEKAELKNAMEFLHSEAGRGLTLYGLAIYKDGERV